MKSNSQGSRARKQYGRSHSKSFKSNQKPINFFTETNIETISTNRKFIIKKINPNMEKNELIRTLKETTIFTRIKCENLMQSLVNYYIQDKTLFVRYDYYDEEKSLFNFLISSGSKLSTQTVIAWLRDLMIALDFLHLHNQVHKNVNLKNVFIINDRLYLGAIGFSVEILNNLKIRSEAEQFLNESDEIDAQYDVWLVGKLLEKLLDYAEKPEEIQPLVDEILEENPSKRPTLRHILKKLVNLNQF